MTVPALHPSLGLPLFAVFFFGVAAVRGQNLPAGQEEPSPRGYVTAESVQSDYGFERFDRKDNDLTFRKRSLVMRWTVNEETIFINQDRFSLSSPILERDGFVWVSRQDVRELVDPMLRPGYLLSSGGFDTVVIDPGHGGHDLGARTTRLPEKDYTLDLALRLRDEVRKLGLRARLTREEDEFVGLAERVRRANETPRSVFVSLHFTRAKEGAMEGIGTIALNWNSAAFASAEQTPVVRQQEAESLGLATSIQGTMLRQLERPDRGISRSHFQVFQGLMAPAVLIEGGFLSHPRDLVLIDSEAFRQKMAESIARGILDYRRAVGRGS